MRLGGAKASSHSEFTNAYLPFPPETKMTVTAITSYNQFKQVVSPFMSNRFALLIRSFQSSKTSDEKRPVVIDFYATWCGPCRLISPKFLEWSNKETAVDFYQVDIDEQPAIAREVSIRVVSAGANISSVRS